MKEKIFTVILTIILIITISPIAISTPDINKANVINSISSNNSPPNKPVITIPDKIVVGKPFKIEVILSDPDGDDLAYSASNLPVGAVFHAATRTFTWKPTQGQLGRHNVTFMVSDNGIPRKLDSEGITIIVITGGVPRIFFPVGPT